MFWKLGVHCLLTLFHQFILPSFLGLFVGGFVVACPGSFV